MSVSTFSRGDPQQQEITPEIAAMKSGLGPFYGRLLLALERIADALEQANKVTRGKANA